MKPAHRAALEALADDLAELEARGLATPCQSDRRLWLSDDAATLNAAALACAPCPVLDQCAEAGRFETGGAWGGLVVGKPPRRPCKPRTTHPDPTGEAMNTRPDLPGSTQRTDAARTQDGGAR